MSTTPNNPSRAVIFGDDSLRRSVQMSSPDELHRYHTCFDEGQTMKTSQQDELMNLKIRVAVLESELAYARKEKEDSLLSLRIVVESLTHNSTSASGPSTAALPSTQHAHSECESHVSERKHFEDEIKRLRRENRFLKERSRVKDTEASDSFTVGTPEHDSDSELRENPPVRVDYRGLQNVPTGPRLNQHKPVLNPPNAPALVGSWGQDQSFDDSIPTVPNSPVSSPANLALRNFDVGCYSLEENLDDDGPPQLDAAKVHLDGAGFPTSLVASVSLSIDDRNRVESKEYPELEKTIDQQLAEQNISNLDFIGPAPSVLKTGFQVGGKLGGEYDPSNTPEAPRTYRRSACLWREPSSAQQSHDNVRMSDTPFDSNLWDSFEDREGAIQANMRLAKDRFRRGGDGERAFPDMFRHGIQYKPEETDSNYLRTVLITNLPPDTEIREVLARVRGGEVLHATMLDTLKITGSMSAKVIFLMEGAAEDYVVYAADHPITFGDEKHEADVELINTPTYPLNPRRSQSLREREQTRCIAVPGFPEDISLTGLERTLACRNGYRAESLVEHFIDEAGTLHLQFSSVDIAGSAYGILTSRRIYGGSFPVFEADPCAGTVEELEKDVPSRPPMLPRNGRPRSSNESENSDDRGDGVVREVEGMQRRQLAALNNQKVEIPSFSGSAIKFSSWADEVIDEADDDISPLDISRAITLSCADRAGSGDQRRAANGTKDNVDVDPKLFEELKKPVGLAGSKYASLVPDFEDRGERHRFRQERSDGDGFDTAMSPLIVLEREQILNDDGLDHDIAQELAKQAEVQSEPTFNTFTRQSSPEDLDCQNSQLNTRQVFHSQEALNLSENRFSRSPPRVNLDILLASSSSSISSSESPVLPPPFDLSAFEIIESTSPSTGEPAVEVQDDSSENKSPSTESEPCSPKTVALKPTSNSKDKKNVTFAIPASENMDSVSAEAGEQAGLGLSSGVKTKRKRDDEENLVKEAVLVDAKAGHDDGNGLGGIKEIGDGSVINPDEISLDEDEDE